MSNASILDQQGWHEIVMEELTRHGIPANAVTLNSYGWLVDGDRFRGIRQSSGVVAGAHRGGRGRRRRDR